MSLPVEEDYDPLDDWDSLPCGCCACCGCYCDEPFDRFGNPKDEDEFEGEDEELD